SWSRRARRDQDGAERDGLPQPALQRPHELEHRARWGGETCIRIAHVLFVFSCLRGCIFLSELCVQTSHFSSPSFWFERGLRPESESRKADLAGRDRRLGYQ